MLQRLAPAAVLIASTVVFGLTIVASDHLAKPGDLTVHEWGTFTTVAGPDGKTAQWLPLGGPTDLPCFVNHYQNIVSKLAFPGEQLAGQPIDYDKARSQLLGSVRMETPVLYFYSPRAQSVSAAVRFPQGFITEWYPLAAVKQLVIRPNSLQRSNPEAAIEWKNVEILPPVPDPSFIRGSAPSHYYAARETDANAIRVGVSQEKFLFYRGVGSFPVPINVTTTTGDRILLKHLTGKPSVILFETRGGKMGYRVVDTAKNEAVVELPELTADFASLRAELESVLTAQGLYPREAKAMVNTWRDSWFEEGVRVFYIVPPPMVDVILPLTIEPKPAHVARVFVGRVEVITPATIHAVEEAIRAGDAKTLEPYGRFLGPITELIADQTGIAELRNAALAKYASAAAGCSN
jgi:hypothetical protein